MDVLREYIIYPQAREKLKSAGIFERIEEIKDETESLNHIDKETIRECVKELEERKYYDALPEQERKTFKTKLSALFKNFDSGSWKVTRGQTQDNDEVSIRHFPILIGESASLILEPSEFADYQRHGFNSFSAWIGCIGALLEEEIRSIDLENNYVWESTSHEGKTTRNSIGGNTHGDLFVHQLDLTPYPTIDPLGNPVEYRPIGSKDRRVLAPYHSTEGSLLVAVLDFIQQNNVPSKIVEDKAKSLIDKIRSSGRKRGNWGETFSDPSSNISLFFTSYGREFSKFKTNGEVIEKRGHSLELGPSRGAYIACISPSGNLGFYSDEEKNKPELIIEFQNQDLDHIIEGLVHQAQQGLGRTHPGTLANILGYCFSPK